MNGRTLSYSPIKIIEFNVIGFDTAYRRSVSGTHDRFCYLRVVSSSPTDETDRLLDRSSVDPGQPRDRRRKAGWHALLGPIADSPMHRNQLVDQRDESGESDEDRAEL